MTTYAKLSKYLANRQSKYEKQLASPIEAERNTAHRMLERIGKRKDELFEMQEAEKAPAPQEEVPMFFNGGRTGFGASNRARRAWQLMAEHGREGDAINAHNIQESSVFPTFNTNNGGFEMPMPLWRKAALKSMTPTPLVQTVNSASAPKTEPAAEPVATTGSAHTAPVTLPDKPSFTRAKGKSSLNKTPEISMKAKEVTDLDIQDRTDLRDWGIWDSSELKGLGDFAKGFAPHLAGFAAKNYALGKVQKPSSPVYTPPTHLNKRLDTGADENMIRRLMRTRQMNAERNAPNAQAALGEYGKSTADAMTMHNQLSQQRANYRSQMENAEAGINSQTNAQNTYMANQHLSDMNAFENNKISAKANTITNLLDKYSMQLAEGRMKKHDITKMKIYLSRLPENLRADYIKQLMDQGIKFE